MKRRTFIAGAASTAVGIAGCVNVTPESENNRVPESVVEKYFTAFNELDFDVFEDTIHSKSDYRNGSMKKISKAFDKMDEENWSIQIENISVQSIKILNDSSFDSTAFLVETTSFDKYGDIIENVERRVELRIESNGWKVYDDSMLTPREINEDVGKQPVIQNGWLTPHENI